jgi:hypothetical protein
MPSFWRTAFRLLYQLLALMDPIIRAVWRRGGIGNVLELKVAKRNGQGFRSRLIGLLQSGGQLYLGHPSGHVGWTRDLAASGRGSLFWPNGDELHFGVTALSKEDAQREDAIRATGQHPFPGNLVYRLGRRHVRDHGIFFRLEPVPGWPRA